MGKRRLKKTAETNAEIAEALNYLREQNPRAAEDFYQELRARCDLLQKFPELFPVQNRSRHPRLRGVRMAVIPRFKYLAYYTFDDTTVTLLRVVHGSREDL